MGNKTRKHKLRDQQYKNNTTNTNTYEDINTLINDFFCVRNPITQEQIKNVDVTVTKNDDNNKYFVKQKLTSGHILTYELTVPPQYIPTLKLN